MIFSAALAEVSVGADKVGSTGLKVGVTATNVDAAVSTTGVSLGKKACVGTGVGVGIQPARNNSKVPAIKICPFRICTPPNTSSFSSTRGKLPF